MFPSRFVNRRVDHQRCIHLHSHANTVQCDYRRSGVCTYLCICALFPREAPKPAQLYRALRREETPWNMRIPAEHLKSLPLDQLRVLLVQGVAEGNLRHRLSQFLHATTSWQTALNIASERASLYSGIIVRFDVSSISAECIIDLSTRAGQSYWFAEHDSDSEAKIEQLRACRMFTLKDKEVALMQKPRVLSWMDSAEAPRFIDDTNSVYFVEI